LGPNSGGAQQSRKSGTEVMGGGGGGGEKNHRTRKTETRGIRNQPPTGNKFRKKKWKRETQKIESTYYTGEFMSEQPVNNRTKKWQKYFRKRVLDGQGGEGTGAKQRAVREELEDFPGATSNHNYA